MLLQMRTFARSWIAYLLLFILTVAFAIWGIKDVFNRVGAQNLVEVGGQAITPPELSRELDNALKRARANGQNVTQEEAIAQGAHLQLLEQMINQRASLAYAQRLGVAASDESVRSFLVQIPGATNPLSGRLDPQGVASFARDRGYTPDGLVEEIRSDIVRAMLMQTLVGGVRAPTSYGAMLYSFGGETRVVSVAQAPASTLGAIAPPTAQQLQTFWQDNQEGLRLPEFRHLTLIYARAADFAPRVNITDQQLRAEFERQRPGLTQAEKRSYVRLVAPNQAQANDAAARINRGENPQAVAAALHLQITTGTNEARTAVPDARVAEAVFSMAAHAPARVVQGQLTPWAVVRVDTIAPAVTPSFESVRDQIRTALANDQASALMDTAVTAFEDARSAGTSAAQAARENGLAVVDIPAVEAQGRDTAGAEVAALAGQREVLQTAFQTPEGEASDFMPTANGEVVVAVNGITPTRVRPLAEVREQLTQSWIARERARRLREKGEQFVASLHGQNFAAAVRAQHFEMVIPSHAFTREQISQAVPSRGLPAQIFAANEGAVLSDVRLDGQSVIVAIVEHINRADPAANPQQVEAARAQMQQSLAQSFDEALQSQIVAEAHPRRNERLIQQQFNRNAAEQENQ